MSSHPKPSWLTVFVEGCQWESNLSNHLIALEKEDEKADPDTVPFETFLPAIRRLPMRYRTIFPWKLTSLELKKMWGLHCIQTKKNSLFSRVKVGNGSREFANTPTKLVYRQTREFSNLKQVAYSLIKYLCICELQFMYIRSQGRYRIS